MKTIISPTDYSENAWHATEYAASLAQKMAARLVLFHAFELPVITSEALLDIPSVRELTDYHQARLAEQKELLTKAYGIDVQCVVQSGAVVPELCALFDKVQADLVVMGLRGANPLQYILMGSVAVSLLRKAQVPVLVVPADYTYHPIHRILFACDMEPADNPRMLYPLKEIARTFEAMIEVLHIEDSQAYAGSGEPTHHWESELSSLKHGYTFLHQENVQKGIDQSVRESRADLLVMIPHQHSFFEHLLDKSNTQKMVFHTHVPLLALAGVATFSHS